MSAPYWGQLPPSKARRMSDDFDQTDRRQSLDQSTSDSRSRSRSQSHSQSLSRSQSQPRPLPIPPSKRASVQTTHTDAYTDSTFSPFQTPTTPYFQDTGLAPRPPSLPYGQNQYPPELQERRRRRTSQPPEIGFHDETPASPLLPPAAPDVPKAPPVSYRDPYRHSSPAFTPTYSYNADGQPGPPLSAYRYGSPRYGSPQTRTGAMDIESFYNTSTPPPEKQGKVPILDRSRENFGEDGVFGGQVGADNERSRPIRRSENEKVIEKGTADPAPPKRRGTISAPVKRPTWADDRSPLQKLELTLDSITKEEKRARVEAAEQRARDRAVRRDEVDQERLQLPSGHRTGQQARLKDRREHEDRPEEPRAIVPDQMQAQPSAAVFRGPLSQNPTEDTGQNIASDHSLGSRIPVAKNRNVPPTEKADLPQRNLSFRERAAKNDLNLPKEVESTSPASPITPPSGGFSLTRSGSNKLKKNPPGDPWYSMRREAEEKSAAQNQRNIQPEERTGPPRNTTIVDIAQSNNGSPRKLPLLPVDYPDRPPARGKRFDSGEDYDDSFGRQREINPAIGYGRTESTGTGSSQQLPYQSSLRNTDAPKAPTGSVVKSVKFPERHNEAQMFEGSEYESEVSGHGLGFHDYLHRGKLRPGRGMYQRPTYLDEWKTATVGTLHGPLLDLIEEPSTSTEKTTPWWEGSGSTSKRRGSTTTRPQQFDGAYDDAQVPTRFRPQLYLKCGPLLRYCGLRHEKPVTRTSLDNSLSDREIWRGSVMIVTQDSQSSYDIPPILRLFVQPIELLPPPPAELHGELPPEYVDPIAGIPKLGRRGETLYVRPVEHLEEGKDVSRFEPDDGLFEITRSAPDFNNAPDPPGSFTSRKRRTPVDGEKLGKYKDVRGFRLHTERGHTFWRFNIEVELREKQQRVAYRINHGPATAFWVPARGQSMNIMFHSCNGFSLSVNPDEFSGPDPMWRDVLNNHQTRPFHVMIGGGDQVYNDAIMRDTRHFQEWLHIKNPLHKNNAPFTAEMQDEMEQFYLDRYSMWFSQGLFGLANCQIPMVNMYDDHDIIDGFGSYPHHFMKSPVFTGLGNVAFKYYMLFQHQSLPEETEQSEPSWVLGMKQGPYIHELSRSMFIPLGAKVSLLAVDCRTERTRNEVVRENTWKKLMDRCYDEITKNETQHLLVLLGVPIAYPRLVWLENILTSRLMDPIKALGKAGMLGNFLNRFDGGVEVLDDLDDHWTAKNHKDERRFVIEDLQDLAADKSVRVTILSGDVHLAAVGQFYSNAKQNLAKHKDFRYMPNIISSAIANTPPPDLMADILNKRNKIHHFDKETDEDMIPIFTNGVDGKPRNNKRLLPHRNWCSIREYVPGQTPPPTPSLEDYDLTPEGTPPGSRVGLFRKFSLTKNRGPTIRPDVAADRSRPPLSSGSGLFRSFSRRRTSSENVSRPNKILRTLSLGRGDPSRPRGSGLFGRKSSIDRSNDGGINGDWGPDSEEDMYDDVQPPARQRVARPAVYGPGHSDYGSNTSAGNMGYMRGGAGDHRNDEYEVGDDSFFTARSPRRAVTQPVAASTSYNNEYNRSNDYNDYYNRESSEEAYDDTLAPPTRPFKRTPTGLSTKLLKKRGPEHFEVDIQGGLEVCLNVEVNPKDPAGITVPYRLLVPRLWYEYQGEDGGHDTEPEIQQGRREEIPQAPTPGPPPAPASMMSEDLDEEYEDDYEEKPTGGLLKRIFSGRGRRASEGGGGGGSHYRARRQSP